jgi:predicted amidophosphoribosyltransferase
MIGVCEKCGKKISKGMRWCVECWSKEINAYVEEKEQELEEM